MDSSQSGSQAPLDPLNAITHICNVKQSAYGINCPKEIIKRCAVFYHFDFVILGELNAPDCEVIQTILRWAHSTLKENSSYDLDGTLCENVLGCDQICRYDRDRYRSAPKKRTAGRRHTRHISECSQQHPDLRQCSDSGKRARAGTCFTTLPTTRDNATLFLPLESGWRAIEQTEGYASMMKPFSESGLAEKVGELLVHSRAELGSKAVSICRFLQSAIAPRPKNRPGEKHQTS